MTPGSQGQPDLRAWCGAEKGQGGRAGLPDPCALHPSAPETCPEPKVRADLAVSETKAWGDRTWSHYEV